jgi:drug/metabolite transporter (DMT)-like permease
MGRDRSFYVTLLVLGLSQGASYPLIRVAVRELSPAALMELRILFAVPVLVGYCALTHQAGRLRAAWREGTAVGITGFAIPYILIGWGSIHVDSGVVAVANAAVPIFVVLVAIRFLPGERVTGLRLLGVLVGLAGVGVLSGLHPVGGWWGVAGTLAVVAAAPAYALSFVVMQRAKELDVVVVATAAMIVGGLVLLPFALATLPASPPSPKTLAATAALGVVSTGFSCAVFYWMLSWHGAARASLLTYVTPLFTLAIAAWFLGEPLTPAKTGGLALIVAGVALGAGTRTARPVQAAVAPAR